MTGSVAARKGALVAASLLGLSFAAGSPARAADDGYANVFSSVLGAVGVISTDKTPDIEYRERPPLVLPPGGALPKPVTGGAARTAAWPQDPDVLKHRKEAEEARAPHTLDRNSNDKGVVLSKAEMLKGRAQGEPVRPNECGNDGKVRNCMVLNPDVLEAEGERYRALNPEKSDALVAGQEPEREYLTQPPKGYMKASKSVKATTEAPQEKIDDSSVRYMQQQAQKKKDEE